MKAAIVGGGLIGGGWAARFLLHGWDVSVADPNPKAEAQVGEILDNARQWLPALADVPLPAEGTLTFSESLIDAVSDADWVQESVPEELALKHKVLAEIQANAPDNAIVGSSTSGFKPSELQESAKALGKFSLHIHLIPFTCCHWLKSLRVRPVMKACGPKLANTSSPSAWNR